MNFSVIGVKKEKLERSIREVSSRDCAGCGEPTRTLYIFSCGKCWHKECYRCSRTSCRKVLKERKAVIYDDEPYCSKLCAETKDEPKNNKSRNSGGGDRCWQCKKRLNIYKDDIITKRDHLWHSECFACAECKKPFIADYYITVNDSHYCKRSCSVVNQPEEESRGRERSRSRKRNIVRSSSQPRRNRNDDSPPRSSSKGRLARSSSKGRLPKNDSPEARESPRGRGRHISRNSKKLRPERSASQPRQGRHSKKGRQSSRAKPKPKKTREEERADFQKFLEAKRKEVQVKKTAPKKSEPPNRADMAKYMGTKTRIKKKSQGSEDAPPPDFARMLSPDSMALFRKALTKPSSDNITQGVGKLSIVNMTKVDEGKANGVIMCENCEENPAVVFCEQCSENQCAECDKLMHRSKKKKMHTRTPLKSQDLSSSENNSSQEKKLDRKISKEATWEGCKVPVKPKPKPKKTNVQTNSMTGTQPSSQSSGKVKAPPKSPSSSAVIKQTKAQPSNQGYTTISTQKVVNPQVQAQRRTFCGFCRKALLQNQKIIQVQGYSCHFTCFVCWNCKKQLGNGGYINRGRFFFCSLTCADEGVEKWKALQKKNNAGRNI